MQKRYDIGHLITIVLYEETRISNVFSLETIWVKVRELFFTNMPKLSTYMIRKVVKMFAVHDYKECWIITKDEALKYDYELLKGDKEAIIKRIKGE